MKTIYSARFALSEDELREAVLSYITNMGGDCPSFGDTVEIEGECDCCGDPVTIYGWEVHEVEGYEGEVDELYTDILPWCPNEDRGA